GIRADADDDEIGGHASGAGLDGLDGGGTGEGRGVGLLEEGHTGLLVDGFAMLSEPLTELGRQRTPTRAEDDGATAAVELRRCGDLESDPTAADNGDLLALAELSADGHGISGIPESVDVGQLGSRHVEGARGRPGRQDRLSVLELLAVVEG